MLFEDEDSAIQWLTEQPIPNKKSCRINQAALLLNYTI
jgi:hypothetical protein